MNLEEYNKVKDFTYTEYCDYLKKKYGEAKCDYFTKNFNRNNKISRTKEGLYCHHIDEDKFCMLSTPQYAKMVPFDYQKADRLCYCDYLEHLFLHILICKYPNPDFSFVSVGVGGVLNYLVPELNDVYSGFKASSEWMRNCHSKIINDKEVYLILLQRFLKETGRPHDCLLTSYNQKFGLWQIENNFELFDEFRKLKTYF